jgi:2',3'-cyclic-nucleotide 2'-phosphodiesterase / 3'-nucleotidase
MLFTSMPKREVVINILETSDVHGNFFPYDFINHCPAKGSMARISAFVKEKRKQMGDNVILLDNGDILQGQPTSYYYNFIDKSIPHLAASVLNYMGYDAIGIGNHDIETGLDVLDRWSRQCQCSTLCANMVNASTGKPHFKPYTIFVREGVRIAVLGLTSPAIPHWVPRNLWEGVLFEDLLQSARHWLCYIKEHEHPHVTVCLVHSGKEGGIVAENYRENAVLDIVRNLTGIDIMLFGHDHKRFCGVVKNPNGEAVVCLNPSAMAWSLGNVEVRVTLDDDVVLEKKIRGQLSDVNIYDNTHPAVRSFNEHFSHQFDEVETFVSRKIGTLTHTIYEHDSYFGPSDFIALVHTLQMQLTGAEISFAAPLSYDAVVKAGNLTVRDTFNLYKFENLLVTIRLTGHEIKDFLEMDYALWTNRMKSPDDHLLLMKSNLDSGRHLGIANYAYNFDSAAGINYTVNVTQPRGHKINILGMSDGRPFEMRRTYTVVTNSYRSNGGGELLTKGAGIPQTELASRLIWSSDLDLRYYLMKAIEKNVTLNPVALNNWHFIPLEWTQCAALRDKKLLFGKNASL